MTHAGQFVRTKLGIGHVTGPLGDGMRFVDHRAWGVAPSVGRFGYSVSTALVAAEIFDHVDPLKVWPRDRFQGRVPRVIARPGE